VTGLKKARLNFSKGWTMLTTAMEDPDLVEDADPLAALFANEDDEDALAKALNGLISVLSADDGPDIELPPV
jgi:hypothetical protein